MLLDEALPHLPRLRRYARLLTGDSARAIPPRSPVLAVLLRHFVLSNPIHLQ